MIAQITGAVEDFSGNVITLRVGGISYEIHVPTAVMRSLESHVEKEKSVTLITYHYYQTDPSKSIPILIGFANRIEKEFFEKFITVSGVGPKAAVKALGQPIPDIAAAIDAGDLAFLKSLPGVGEQRAREIIAKLQGKMGKFALIQTNGSKKSVGTIHEPPLQDIRQEALDVLLQLQYKKDEALNMIQKAFTRRPGLSNIEEVLNEVYQSRKVKL